MGVVLALTLWTGGCLGPERSAGEMAGAQPAPDLSALPSPRCPEEQALIRDAALRLHPSWQGRGEVRIVRLGQTPRFIYFHACSYQDGAIADRCAPLVLDDTCAAAALAERRAAAEAALPEGATEFAAIETLYPELPVPADWDPSRPSGREAADYTMVFAIPSDKPLLLFDLFSQLRFGARVTGLPRVQLGGAAVRRLPPHENAPFSFVIDPQSVDHMQEYEECDAWPAYIEANLESWLRRRGGYTCPWSLGVVALLYRDARGARRLALPVDYEPARAALIAFYDRLFGARPSPLAGALPVASGALPFLP